MSFVSKNTLSDNKVEIRSLYYVLKYLIFTIVCFKGPLAIIYFMPNKVKHHNVAGVA